MHGELRVTVIATGFDRTVAPAETAAPPARPAAGVLPFEKRAPRPTPTLPPGYGKPGEPPPVRRPAAPGGAQPEVNEMEIPTFIRRQMD
jgi:hypothetical protein